MSWKYLAFGNDNPSALRIVVNTFVLLVGGLAFFGAVIADFVPTDSWRANSRYLTTSTTIVVITAVFWGRYTGRIVPIVRVSKLQNAFSLALAPFVVFGAFWLVFTYAIPDVTASVMAAESSKTISGAVYERQRKRNSWGCDFYIRGDAAKNAFMGSICSADPIGDVRRVRGVHGRIVLTVKETAVGYHVVRVDDFFPTNGP